MPRANEGVGDGFAFLEAVERHHPDPFRYVDRSALVDAAARIAAIADRDRLVVELMRLAALLGPRNGHSGIFVSGEHRLPPARLRLDVYEFQEGAYVLDAADESLVGAEVVAVAGSAVDDVLDAIAPLVPCDNEWTLRARRPEFMTTADVLCGLGIPVADDEIPFRLRLPGGALREVVPPRRVDRHGRARDAPRWNIDLIDQGRAVHVRYNSMRDDTRRLAQTVVDAVASARSRRLVLDLRGNGGGDNRTYGPLLGALEQLDTEGVALRVLTSRNTFSAAMQLVVDLERRTAALFIGEPTGGSPNQYGDAIPVRLPTSGLTGHVATIAWTTAGADDERLTREPDLVVPTTASAFFAARDEALAVALAA